MNKIYTRFMVVVLAMSLGMTAMNAADITVFDGTQVSVYVPLPTASYNEGGTRGQVIYPASALEDMVGQPINGLTFYVNDEGCKMNGGTLRVSMREVENTAFSSKTFFSGLTTVAMIEMTYGQHEIDIDFEDPYIYEGGNLLIDFYVKKAGESGAYNFTYFYGLYQQEHTSLTTGDEGNEYREFIPKTTFYYGEKDAVAARVNPRAVTFNTVRAGDSDEQTVLLTNTGLNAFTPVVTATAPFSATVPQAPVQPGETVELTAVFAPASAGVFEGTLLVDCGNGVVLEVPMTGEALENGEHLTVCDSENTNNKLPFNGIYFSDAGTYGQMIYPADMLTDMAGCKIVALSFFTKGLSNLKDGTVQLSLKTADQSEFTTAAPVTDLVAVASMPLVKGVDVITFEFDEPFDYAGGNLVVEARVIDSKGNYGTTLFYGVTTSNYAGLSVTHSQWTGDNAERVKFLPKVDFVYQEAPAFIRGDVDMDGEIGIADVTALIDYILTGNNEGIDTNAADCDQDAVVGIADVTALIDYILTHTW